MKVKVIGWNPGYLFKICSTLLENWFLKLMSTLPFPYKSFNLLNFVINFVGIIRERGGRNITACFFFQMLFLNFEWHFWGGIRGREVIFFLIFHSFWGQVLPVNFLFLLETNFCILIACRLAFSNSYFFVFKCLIFSLIVIFLLIFLWQSTAMG